MQKRGAAEKIPLPGWTDTRWMCKRNRQKNSQGVQIKVTKYRMQVFCFSNSGWIKKHYSYMESMYFSFYRWTVPFKTSLLFFKLFPFFIYLFYLQFDRDDSHPQLLTHSTESVLCVHWLQEVCRSGQREKDFSLELAANLLTMLAACRSVCVGVCVCSNVHTHTETKPATWLKAEPATLRKTKMRDGTELSVDNGVLVEEDLIPCSYWPLEAVWRNTKHTDHSRSPRELNDSAEQTAETRAAQKRHFSTERCRLHKNVIAAPFLRTIAISFISWWMSCLPVISHPSQIDAYASEMFSTSLLIWGGNEM